IVQVGDEPGPLLVEDLGGHRGGEPVPSRHVGNQTGDLGPGLLTWCESWCEVCGLEEPKTRLAYHVIPGHRLEGVATLHNYLASIFTVSGRPSRKRCQ